MSSKPKFQYNCTQCGAPAKKPALKNHKDWAALDPKDFGGLGGWKCTGRCRGKIKVKRSKIHEEELQEAA